MKLNCIGECHVTCFIYDAKAKSFHTYFKNMVQPSRDFAFHVKELEGVETLEVVELNNKRKLKDLIRRFEKGA